MTRQLQKIERTALGIVGFVTLISAVFAGASVTAGVALGGLLTVGNFYTLRRLVGALLRGGGKPRQAVLSTLLLLKLAAVSALVYALLVYLAIDGLGLLVGMTVALVAIMLEAARQRG